MIYFNNHQIQIYRRRQVGSANRFSMSATFTAYQTDIQPAGRDRTEFVQGRAGAVFTGFVEADNPAKEGDQIHIIGGTYNGKVFSVKAVQHWQGAGLLDYTELILISQDA
jgi:hypothetical protein